MKKILVVDDDVDLLEVVTYILTSHGFNVKTHSSGFNVPDVVLHYCPNLILLDVRLPGKLGTDICKELKLVHQIPIILFSAHADYNKVFAECKADDFLEKPFDVKKLLDMISTHLNLSSCICLLII